MPRQITPREVDRPPAPIVVAQHVDNINIETQLDSLSGAIDPDRVFLSLVVQEVDESGTIRGATRYQYALADWPAAIKTAVLDLRSAIFTALENQSRIESGTDTGEIAP